MMRFLFYDNKLINILLRVEEPSGGAAVQTYGWIRGLLETGNEVFALTNLEKKGTLKEETKGIQLIPLFDEQRGIRWIRWIYYRFPDIYQKIKQIRPDYLYQSVPGWGCILMGIICKQLGIKYILRISNDYYLDNRFRQTHSLLHSFFLKKGINLTDLILCQNDYQLGMVQKHFPSKKAIKISNPIIYQQDIQPGQQVTNKKYIAWLGLYQYQKNLKLLYEIANLLVDEQFHIAGKESSTMDDTTRLYLKKLASLPNVTFRGFLDREAVLDFLQNAKFLLNTSHYEGFSNTFLEAMIMGTPIISSSRVNPDGIINGFQLGLIYENALDLKNKLEHIPSQQYREMTCNVRKYVSENHHYKVQAQKLMEILRTPTFRL